MSVTGTPPRTGMSDGARSPHRAEPKAGRGEPNTADDRP